MKLTKPIRRSLLIGGFILFAVALFTVGYFYYRYAVKSYRKQIEQELSAIADLKVNEIGKWREERIGDASIFYKNHLFNSLFKQFLSNQNNDSAKKNIHEWMVKVKEHYIYENIYLLDTNRERCLSIPSINFPISSAVSEQISEVIITKQITFVDFYENEIDHRIHLTVLVPIIDELDSNNVIGIIGLLIDPFAYLYPFISNWPTPSKTAETLLLRREGDEIVFLNDLKFQKNAALKLRVSMNSKLAIPAIKAALGEEGIVEALDYRGVPVITAIRSIPGSPWFMVARIDKAEAFAPLKQRLIAILILFVLILIAIGISFYMFLRQQKLRFYRENEESLKIQNEELEKRVTERTIEVSNTFKLNQSILVNAGEGIYGLDLEGNSTFINQAAADMLDYSREELLGKGMHANHHHHKANGSEYPKIECPIYAALTDGKTRTITDEVFWRKDGTPFPVEYTSAPVFSEGKISGSVVLFKDITERKKAEEEIKKANRVYAVLSNINQTIVRVKDKQTLFNEACRIAVEEGKFRMAWIGMIDENSNKVIPVASAGFTADYLETINIDLNDEKHSMGPAGQTIKSGIHFLANDIANNPDMIPWRENALKLEYNSSAGFPIIISGKTIGTFLLYSSEAFFFDESEVKLLDELAMDISFAIEYLETEEKRKQSEAALEESEQLFRNLFLATPDALMLIDPFNTKVDWPIIDCNEVACQMNGFSRDEMIGHSIDILNRTKGTPQERAEYLELLRREGAVHLETIHYHRDGHSFPVDVSTTIVTVNGRELILGIDRNITKRKLAEEKLKQTEQHFRSLIEQGNDIISLVDKNGTIKYTSPSNKVILGYSDDEFIGADGFQFIHPEDHEKIQQLFADIQRYPGKTVTTEMRYRHKDGHYLWFEISGTNQFDNPNLESLITTSRDITERKKAEDSLRENEERFRRTLDLGVVGMATTHPTTYYFLSVNQHLCNMLGYTEEELLQKTWAEITFPKEKVDEDAANVEKLLSGELNGYVMEKQYQHKDGHMIDITLAVQGVRKEDGSIDYILILIDDITDRKLTEKVISKQRDMGIELNSLNILNDLYPIALEALFDITARDSGCIYLFDKKSQCLDMVYSSGLSDAFIEVTSHYEKDSYNVKFVKDGKLAFIEYSELPFQLSDIEYAEKLHSIIVLPLIYNDDIIGCINLTSHQKINDSLIVQKGVEIIGTIIGNAIVRIGMEENIRNINAELENKVEQRTKQLDNTNKKLLNENEERKRAEELARQSERIRIKQFNHSPIGMVLCNMDGAFVDLNPACAKIIGRTVEESLKLTYWDVTPQKYAPQETEQLKSLEETGKYGPYFKEYIHKDGHLVPVELSGLILEINNERFIWSSVQDITERKRAEEKLTLQSMALNAAANAIVIIDRFGHIEWVNPAFTKLTGYTLEEVIGENPRTLKSGRHDDAFYKNMWDTTLGGKVWTGEIINKRKNGSEYTEDMIITPLKDESGEVIRFIAIKQDITERKRAEEQFRLVVESAPNAIILVNIEGEIQLANRQAEIYFGYTRSELIGKKIELLVPEEIRANHPAIRSNFMEHPTARSMGTGGDLFGLRKDGSKIPIEVGLNPIQINEDFILLTIIDITERKLAEAELILSRDILRNSIDNLFVYDPITRLIKDVNETTCGTMGYTKEEFLTMHIDDLDPIFPLDQWSAHVEEVKASKDGFVFETTHKHKDGTPIPVEIIARYVHLGGKDLMIATTRNITERKKAEEEIKKAKDEAEQANLAKSEFLSRMSHELRTPMNSILGFAQLMNMGELIPAHKKGVDHIMKSGKHLLDLINEVLDLSCIEAGRLTISLEPVQICSLITDIIEMIRPLTAKNAIKLELLNSNPDELFVRADQKKLKQVLLNLINNAVKFNRENGSVTISCEVNTSTKLSDRGTETAHRPGSVTIASRQVVRVNIIDTGHGIDAEEINQLFVPFQRIGNKISEIEGTGLGLTVAKKLIEVMGGTIGVTSELGIGSTFWIELPQSESPFEGQRILSDLIYKDTGKDALTGTLLYIEDNISNIQLVEQIMGEHRPSIRLISEMYGKKAVQCAIDYSPDLILLDLDLPDIHGSDVLRLLRLEEKTKSIPVVVISADAMSAQIEKLLKAGAVDYLTKPFDVAEFLKIIDKMMIAPFPFSVI